MKASTTLYRSKDAMQRKTTIDETLEVLRGKVGGSASCLGIKIAVGTVLDPMRQVDALMEREGELRQEREWCDVDIDEARFICRGSAQYVGEIAAKILEQHYCDNMTLREIADGLGCKVNVVRRIVEEGPFILDSYDYTDMRLRGA